MTKQAHVIESAQILFAQFGLKKVTMDEIAKESGISKATLYQHFKNKHDIFDEVVKKEADQLLSEIENAVWSFSSNIERLRAHLFARLSKVQEFVNFYRVTQESWSDYWPFIANVRESFILRERKLLEKVLIKGNEAGEFEVESVDRAAMVMVLALASLEHQWSLNKEGLDLSDIVDMMVNMMIDGIRKR